MVSLAPLPLSLAFLERYRIRARRHYRPSLVGGHLMRRKGQSLEFHELVPYILGDDIRYVDWRASARHGAAKDLLVRSFVSEEQLTLVISVDTCDTMRLPEAMPKMQIAFWLAEAVALIALRSDDRVVLHRLFGRSRVGEMSGSSDFRRKRSGVRSILRRFGEGNAATTANLAVLRPHLPPAAVWLILTDLYLGDDQASMLAREIATVQDGLRWVILIDLDSWPHEKAILGEGVRLIEGPGRRSSDTPVDIHAQNILKVEAEIKGHKQRFRQSIRRAGCDVVSWQWPAVGCPEPDQFFRSAFTEDKVLQRLFMREA